MTETSIPAILVLADGKTFRGTGFGATGRSLGEAVFTTAMTGYQEAMTDPSLHRQLLVMAAPQIGNTGWNDEDNESRDGRIWAAGLIIRDLSARVSNFRATRSLAEEMENQNVVGIKGIDTRTLILHLRNHGSIAAGIFVGEEASHPVEQLVEIVKDQPSMKGAYLSDEVTTDEPYVVNVEEGVDKRYTVVAYDLGLKTTTPAQFAARGIETVVVPANTPLEKVKEYAPNGIFLSNGPGDPAVADEMVAITREILQAEIPLFGICLGNQILGRALGLDTYKLTFGHRGINVPVKNVQTGVIDITSQNHGFALENIEGGSFDTDFGPASVTHVCLNDGTTEGIALDNGMAFSVQFHPESAAGPHDANPLFDQFTALMDKQSPNTRTV